MEGAIRTELPIAKNYEPDSGRGDKAKTALSTGKLQSEREVRDLMGKAGKSGNCAVDMPPPLPTLRPTSKMTVAALRKFNG
jgi:hypothetical protein